MLLLLLFAHVLKTLAEKRLLDPRLNFIIQRYNDAHIHSTLVYYRFLFVRLVRRRSCSQSSFARDRKLKYRRICSRYHHPDALEVNFESICVGFSSPPLPPPPIPPSGRTTTDDASPKSRRNSRTWRSIGSSGAKNTNTNWSVKIFGTFSGTTVAAAAA